MFEWIFQRFKLVRCENMTLWKIICILVFVDVFVFESAYACDQIIFSQPNVEGFPYVSMIDGVFTKHGRFSSNGRLLSPYDIYMKDDGTVYFYYNTKEKYFVFTDNIKENRDGYIRIPGFPNKALTKDLYAWVYLLNKNANKEVLFKYFRYNEAQFLRRNHPLKVWDKKKFSLTPNCIKVGKCPTNSLVFTKKVDKNYPRLIFERLNKTYNGHSVYKARNKRLYLYKSSSVGGWHISTYIGFGKTHFISTMNFVSPELVGKTWKYYSNGWTPSSRQLFCEGEKRTCTSNFCENRGICRENSLSKVYCICKEGFQGKYCENHSPMCEKNLNPLLRNVNKGLNSMGVRFCKQNKYGIDFRIAKCVKDKSGMKWEGLPCPSPYGPSSNTSVNLSQVDLDRDMPTFNIIFMIIAGILMACLPCAHFTCGNSKKSTTLSRIYSMYWSCGALTWVVFIILAYTFNLTQYGQTTFTNLIHFSIASASILYAYTLLETCCSSETKYLCGAKKDKDADLLIKAMLQTQPVISIHGECYHYETKTRTRTVRNSQGHEETRTETYEEKVVTWRGDEEFHYETCRDFSDIEKLPSIEYISTTYRFKFRKELFFSDRQTKEAYEDFKRRFNFQNEGRDEKFESEVRKKLPGYKKRITVYPESSKPIWMNCCCFSFFTVILLTWPFRVLLNNSTRKQEFTLVKVISTSTAIPTFSSGRIKISEEYETYKKGNVSENYYRNLNDAETEASAPPAQVTNPSFPYQSDTNPSFPYQPDTNISFPYQPDTNPLFPNQLDGNTKFLDANNPTGFHRGIERREIGETSFMNGRNSEQSQPLLRDQQNEDPMRPSNSNVDAPPPSYEELFGRR